MVNLTGFFNAHLNNVGGQILMQFRAGERVGKIFLKKIVGWIIISSIY